MLLLHPPLLALFAPPPLLILMLTACGGRGDGAVPMRSFEVKRPISDSKYPPSLALPHGGGRAREGGDAS